MSRKKILITAAAISILALLSTGIYLFLNRNGGMEAGMAEPSDNTGIADGKDGEPENDSGSSSQHGQAQPEEHVDDKVPGTPPEDLSKAEVIASFKTDLDGDKKDEAVEIYDRLLETGSGKEHEGLIKITGSSGTRTQSYIRKPSGMSGIYSDVAFRDFDGDGCKEIFITIPDNGASFSLNYFCIFSYKTGRFFSYTPQNPMLNLEEVTRAFSFKYTGNGKINITNDRYKFSGTMDISDTGIPDTEEAGKAYDRSWVEPAPLELGPDNKLALVGEKTEELYIKLPLAIFGQATSDMTGIVEAWYKTDKTLTPALKRLEIFDFNRDLTVKNKIGDIKVE